MRAAYPARNWQKLRNCRTAQRKRRIHHKPQCKGRDAQIIPAFSTERQHMKFVLSLFLVGMVALATVAQDPPTPAAKPTATPAATPTIPALSDSEKAQAGEFLKEYQQITAKVQTAQQKLIAAPVGEDALILAAALSYREVMGVQAAFGKRFEDWLRNVQARTKCKDCGINLETKTLVPPQKEN